MTSTLTVPDVEQLSSDCSSYLLSTLSECLVTETSFSTLSVTASVPPIRQTTEVLQVSYSTVVQNVTQTTTIVDQETIFSTTTTLIDALSATTTIYGSILGVLDVVITGASQSTTPAAQKRDVPEATCTASQAANTPPPYASQCYCSKTTAYSSACSALGLAQSIVTQQPSTTTLVSLVTSTLTLTPSTFVVIATTIEESIAAATSTLIEALTITESTLELSIATTGTEVYVAVETSLPCTSFYISIAGKPSTLSYAVDKGGVIMLGPMSGGGYNTCYITTSGQVFLTEGYSQLSVFSDGTNLAVSSPGQALSPMTCSIDIVTSQLTCAVEGRSGTFFGEDESDFRWGEVAAHPGSSALTVTAQFTC